MSKLWRIPVVFVLLAAVIACEDEDTVMPRVGWYIAYSIPSEQLPTYGIQDLWFNNARDGWACVEDRILHYDGSRWTVAHTINGSFPNLIISELTALSAARADNIWAIGYAYEGENAAYSEKLFHWDGTNWEVSDTPSGPDHSDSDICFPSAGRGWIASGNGIFSYQGGTWTHPVEDGVCAFSFLDSNNGWACGGEYIHHWDGARWITTEFYAPSEYYEISISDIDFAAPDVGWAVGSRFVWGTGRYPIFLRYNGATWEEAYWPEGEPEEFYALAAGAVGGNGAGWVIGMEPSYPFNTVLWHADGVMAPTRSLFFELEGFPINGLRVLSNGEAWFTDGINIWHFVPKE